VKRKNWAYFGYGEGSPGRKGNITFKNPALLNLRPECYPIEVTIPTGPEQEKWKKEMLFSGVQPGAIEKMLCPC